MTYIIKETIHKGWSISPILYRLKPTSLCHRYYCETLLIGNNATSYTRFNVHLTIVAKNWVMHTGYTLLFQSLSSKVKTAPSFTHVPLKQQSQTHQDLITQCGFWSLLFSSGFGILHKCQTTPDSTLTTLWCHFSYTFAKNSANITITIIFLPFRLAQLLFN